MQHNELTGSQKKYTVNSRVSSPCFEAPTVRAPNHVMLVPNQNAAFSTKPQFHHIRILQPTKQSNQVLLFEVLTSIDFNFSDISDYSVNCVKSTLPQLNCKVKQKISHTNCELLTFTMWASISLPSCQIFHNSISTL